MEPSIQATRNWRSAHPGGAVGILSMSIDRQSFQVSELSQEKQRLEHQLREKYQHLDRKELRQLPVMDAYTQYYKRYKKTYHLLLQLESICQKNKSIPNADPLVQAMFMAELEDLLLTAGHDLARIQGPIKIASAAGDEQYQLINGNFATCKKGDMLTADLMGVFCSIIYGQDLRTQITPQTNHVLYVTYVPPGIDTEKIEIHHQSLERNVRFAFTNVQITSQEIFHSLTGNKVH